MNRLSLRSSRLKFKTLGKLPAILARGIYRIYLDSNEGNLNRLDLETLARILTDYAQKSPQTLSSMLS